MDAIRKLEMELAVLKYAMKAQSKERKYKPRGKKGEPNIVTVPAPAPMPMFSSTAIVCGGLFLVSMAILIVVIVQMVKSDAGMAALWRDHDIMRQMMRPPAHRQPVAVE